MTQRIRVFTIPESGDRCISMMVINEKHYINETSWKLSN